MAIHQASSPLLLSPCHPQAALPPPAQTTTNNQRTTLFHIQQTPRTHPSPQSHAKQLRSGRRTDLEVYAIRRMASNLEVRTRPQSSVTHHQQSTSLPQPDSTQTQHSTHCAFPRTRGLHQTLPAMAASHHSRTQAPCYSTPPSRPPHARSRAQLHNHRTWEETLHTPPDPSDLPCACSHLRTLLLHPDTPTTNNHYILTLDQLALPLHLRLFIDANMNSAFYPTKARYFLTFQAAFTKWLRLQGLPTSLTQHLEPFLQHQWRLHTTHLKQHPRFTARLLRQLQEHLGDNVVLHHADHELQQHFSNHYHTSHQPTSTTTSPPPFQRASALDTNGASARLHHPVYGIVHLKAKKQWQKGRAIVSYFHSMSGNLLRITSRALDITLQHLFPQHLGQLSISQLWRRFHCYLTQTPTDVTLHATNDDLVGFFNSVPQHRLIDAVHSMIQQWQSQQSTHPVTVDTKATGNPFHHSHVGRHYTKHPTQRTLHTSDITTIVTFALNTCIFQACNNTYKQIRGAGIGSQLSPALCNVAITLIENSWHQLHNNLLQHTASYYRYVDNRSLCTTNTSSPTQPSKSLSTTTSSAIPSSWKLWKTSTSWDSTLTFHNAPSPTFNPTNPGRSGIPPAPAASAWLYPALLHDYTQSTHTAFHQPQQRQQLRN